LRSAKKKVNCSHCSREQYLGNTIHRNLSVWNSINLTALFITEFEVILDDIRAVSNAFGHSKRNGDGSEFGGLYCLE